MNHAHLALLALLLLCGAAGCQRRVGTFGDDLAFLRRNVPMIVLEDEFGRGRVAVVGEYQGRVMTSTAGGDQGLSFGWINRPVIEAHQRQPHMNVFGGEDRLWLGPEGGQYSLYFEPGAPFDLEHWQVPEVIDWGAWKTLSVDRRSASFATTCQLVNFSGTVFDMRIDRTVRVLERDQAARALGLDLPPAVTLVSYESDNQLTNAGTQAWAARTGLVSIWILSMYNPSPATTVVIPFKPDPTVAANHVVNDGYFGRIPADRLVVNVQKGILFFRCDGRYRSKLGIGPDHAMNVCGSWDAEHGVLTIVQFTLAEGERAYVNSMWAMQDDPYGGDVVNSYNDGPPEGGGKPLGPFYELESSSPALALEPGASGRHVHRTFHLQGPRQDLDDVCRRVLRASLDQIENAFGNQ